MPHATIFTALLALASPTHAQEEEAPPEGLSVTEVLLGTSLERGRVTSPRTSFSRSDGRIYAVIQVQNPPRAATSVRVAFERVGGPHRNGFTLDIPARRRYRTVARFGASHPPGRYRVVVRTEDGAEVGSAELTITE